ncbi:MAG: NTP transferase domain-containing protein [Ignavibacteria bacterium]|jgi:NDP-sugar pyrophosphorylase family protein
MNYAIIAAGESSRFKAEGLRTPKHLIKLKGEYLIERLIRVAYRNKGEKLFCIINENEPELKNYLLNGSFGIPVELVVKNTVSSMHSLFALAPYLMNEPFCLTTTDSVFDENEFTEFINYSIRQDDVAGTLAITGYIDDEKPLCVELDDNGLILNFSDSSEGYNWATGGVYFFSNKIFNEMQYALDTGISRLRNFLRLLIDRGYMMKGYSFSQIIDVDHVADIKKAEDFLKGSK